MKRDRTFGFLGLLVFFVAFFFVCSITGPLGAAEENKLQKSC